MAVACALVRAGASDSQIAGILLNPDLPIHAHVRDQKGHGPRAYVARQIERALERVEEDPEPPPGTKSNGQASSATWRDRITVHCAADLEGRAIPPREWIVRDWIPAGHITGLYGHGGGGKTTLLTQLLCSATSPNGHWLGMPVRQSQSLGVFCEDDPDEVARKIAAVRDACRHHWADYRQFSHLNRFCDENLLVNAEETAWRPPNSMPTCARS